MEPANSVAMTVICGDKEALFDIPTKQTIGKFIVYNKRGNTTP